VARGNSELKPLRCCAPIVRAWYGKKRQLNTKSTPPVTTGVNFLTNPLTHLIATFAGGPHKHSGMVRDIHAKQPWLWQEGDQKGQIVTDIVRRSLRSDGALDFNPTQQGCNSIFNFGHSWACYKIMAVEYRYGSRPLESWFSQSQPNEPHACFLPGSVDAENIHDAALEGNVDLLRCFLREGVDVHATDKDGNTALHLAARKGHTDAISILLTAGASMNQQRTSGGTALMVAAYSGHVNAVCALLDANADMNLGNKDGETALHDACKQGQSVVISKLLAAGADANIKSTSSGKTAVEVAKNAAVTTSFEMARLQEEMRLMKTNNSNTSKKEQEMRDELEKLKAEVDERAAEDAADYADLFDRLSKAAAQSGLNVMEIKAGGDGDEDQLDKTSFSEIVADKSVGLTVDELRTAMRTANASVTEEQVQQRFFKLDINRDGVVSEEEFVKIESEGKFEQPRILVFGMAQDSTLGLADYMCVSEREMSSRLAKGQQAIIDEAQDRSMLLGLRQEIDNVQVHLDQLYKDKEFVLLGVEGPRKDALEAAVIALETEMMETEMCLDYVLNAEAETSSKTFQNGWKLDCHVDTGEVLDKRLVKSASGLKWHNLGTTLPTLDEFAWQLNTSSSGLRWRKIGDDHCEGQQLKNKNLEVALSAANSQTSEFTQTQWDEFGIDGLDFHHFVKTAAGCFKPADSVLADALSRKTLRKDELVFTQEEWDAFGIRWLRKDDYVRTGDGTYYIPEYVGEKRGMRIQDFHRHPNAVACKLSIEQVIAARLYTTKAFLRINKPLRDLERKAKEEQVPLPVTTYHLNSAVTKLKTLHTKLGSKNSAVDLFRGMSNVALEETFMREGGTELAPMSTTQDLSIALKYSACGNSAVLLRVRSKNFKDRGSELGWLSAFPHEEEFLYPPTTYLRPLKEMPDVFKIGKATFHVVDVEAQ